MRRGLLGIIYGLSVWACLWFGLNAGLHALFPRQFRPDGSSESFVLNLIVVLLSFDFSFFSGWVNAIISKTRQLRFAFWQGACQFAIAAFAQSLRWDAQPLWFHIGFLGFIFPAIMAGVLYRNAKDEQEIS